MRNVRFYGLSDTGLVRAINQDSFCATYNINNDFLAVVCDGIGGGKAGDVASQLACDVMRDAFLKNPDLNNDDKVRRWLKAAIKKANDIIFMQSSSHRSQNGMGTTMVGVIATNCYTYVFNIGDSRAYGLYDDLIALTEDHNLLNDLIKSNEISPEEAKGHPKRHVLTNALGIWNDVHVDIARIDDDYLMLMLCSDGLHGYVSEKDIKKILLGAKGLKQKTRELIDEALNAGGYDNITVILMDRNEGDTYD